MYFLELLLRYVAEGLNFTLFDYFNDISYYQLLQLQSTCSRKTTVPVSTFINRDVIFKGTKLDILIVYIPTTVKNPLLVIMVMGRI